jgi:hypothetical protein
MLIVWGKRRIERNQGMVADFCPICREIRVFALIRVGLANHIYYVSFGQGKLAGFIIRCDTCGVALKVESNRFATTEKDPRTELETLIKRTFPRLREVHAQRLEIEHRIKRTRSALAGEQYKEFLMEPFALLNPAVEQRFAASTEMDKQSQIGCLGTILLGAGLFFGSLAFRGPTQDRILICAAVLSGIGFMYTLVQLHLAPKRFFRAHLLPSLVKCLKPLEPTRQDIADCLERCKTLGFKIGQVAKVDEIWVPLERQIAGFNA